MNKLIIKTSILAALLGCSSWLSAEQPSRPGQDGGVTGSFCNGICRFILGSCQISSGDPDIPPLQDPFCQSRMRECMAACTGAGSGGIRLGSVELPSRQDWKWSPVTSLICASSPSPTR